MSGVDLQLQKVARELRMLDGLYQQYRAAVDAFNSRWEDRVPANEIFEGGAATILDVVDGDRLVMVSFDDTVMVYPIDISGSVKQQDSSGCLYIEDRRGGNLLLASVGIVPRADGTWQEHCFCLRDEPYDLGFGLGFLKEQKTDNAERAALLLGHYIQDNHSVVVTLKH